MSSQQHAGNTASLFATRAPGWSILVRLLVGLAVFFPEGIQKLVFSGYSRGRALREYRHSLSRADGAVCRHDGDRLRRAYRSWPVHEAAAIPLIVIMIVAIVSTKLPILLGHDFRIFHLPKLSRYGFWSMMHEARTDFCMLLGSLYLLIEGAGTWPLDAMLARKRALLTSRED